MKIIICSFALLLVLFACKDKTSTDTCPVAVVGKQLFSPEEVLLSDIASDMKIIPLETNDSCLIGRGLEFQIRDEGILFRDVRLLLFDAKGQFVRTLFNIGPGPDEVDGFLDYSIRDSLIYITTLSYQCRVYNFRGELKDQYKIPIFTNGLAALGNGKFISAMYGWGNGDISGRVVFFDKERVIKTLRKPYSIDGVIPDSYPMGKEAKFISFEGDTYMKETLCDTIYKIDVDNDTIRPVLAYDFGKWKSNPSNRYNVPVQELFMKIPYTIFLGLSKQSIYLTTMAADMDKRESIDAVCIYDRINNTARTVRFVYSKEDVAKIKSVLNNGFDAERYKYFVPTSLSADGEYLCALIQQTNDNNPAIIAVRLKKVDYE